MSVSSQVAWLGSAVGEPARDFVIAGEGNVSGFDGEGRLWVSASGARLAELQEEDLVAVRPDELLSRLQENLDDEAWLDIVTSSQQTPGARRPTVEVALHAVLAAEHGAPCFVAHAHPTALLPLLCSDIDLRGYAQQRLIPDHIVMLGVADCVLDYYDPGRVLAFELRSAVTKHRNDYGEIPRLVLARNHGVFTIGSTAQQALDRLDMAAKMARVAHPVHGHLHPLPVDQIARISGREDELYRQHALQ